MCEERWSGYRDLPVTGASSPSRNYTTIIIMRLQARGTMCICNEQVRLDRSKFLTRA